MLVKLSVIAVFLVGVSVLAYTSTEKFTGAEAGAISLDEASGLAMNYQTTNPEGVKSHFFGRESIETILAQEGAVGVRIYYGLDEAGVQHLVMVGADADQNDQVQGLLAQMAPPCPPLCGDGNRLNNETLGDIAQK